MQKLVLIVAALAGALWVPVWGRSADSPLQSAALASDRGDYISALKTYLQILDSPGARDALPAIALQTGELYRTTELTDDGEAPLIAPDSRHVAYETGAGLARRVRMVAIAAIERPVELSGFGAAFSVDGSRIAYLRMPTSAAAQAAQAGLETAPPAERGARLAALMRIIASEGRLTVRNIATGEEKAVDTGALRISSIAYSANGLVVAGSEQDASPVQIFEIADGAMPVPRTAGETDKVIQGTNTTGTALFFTTRTPAGAGRGGGRGGAGAAATFGLLSLADGRTTMITGSSPAFSRDGASFAFVARDGAESRLMIGRVSDPSHLTVVRKGPERIDAPAFSPDGTRLAFQMMPNDDWEIYIVGIDGTEETRVTREIQHDVLPMFLGRDRLLAVIGEPRHRRSYLYDLPSLTRTRLFHNNSVRTIAPEYSWTPAPDGNRLVIVAERDGDTVSPERGVYLTDLTSAVTIDEVRARVKSNLDREQALAATGKRLFAPIADGVKSVVAEVSVPRIYGYEKTLFDFDSKYVTQPGNKRAAAFLFDTYQSFGYEPEYQTFEYRSRNGAAGQTANVVATLKGTVNPELIYVVSSHYDSVAVGPGADDDSSGTAALLETARILAGHAQAATIVFASFTGEEAGLLGSREFVRRAVENKLHVAGALNNDMIGWSNDYRLDNTIRYSNAGIRDVQHAAAMQFSNLITYDALYYKNTDAAAYFEAYGDIVGGIGSYPVLGNPHYHQSHDLLEGINHQLVAEVAKTTAATLMLLASSPSRLTDLRVESYRDGTAALSWKPSPEKTVTGYLVSYAAAKGSTPQQTRAVKPTVTLSAIAPGTVVSVKAINAKGLEGWDWAKVTVR